MQEIQTDELVALVSIFGDDVARQESDSDLFVEFPRIGATPSLRIEIVLPPTYPTHDRPVVTMASAVLDESVIRAMVRQLEEMFVPGDVVGFPWLTWVQSEWEELNPIQGEGLDGGGHDRNTSQGGQDSNSDNSDERSTDETDFDHYTTCDTTNINNYELRHHHLDTTESPPVGVPIFSGPVLTEKKSRFQGHIARISNLEDVSEVMDTLLMNNKIRNATHNIMAYRIQHMEPGGVLQQDFDDDGEQAAGGRLLHMLQAMDLKNIIVVVSRWFGGVLLGPPRFSFINNAARAAIEESGWFSSAAVCQRRKSTRAESKRKK